MLRRRPTQYDVTFAPVWRAPKEVKAGKAGKTGKDAKEPEKPKEAKEPKEPKEPKERKSTQRKVSTRSHWLIMSPTGSHSSCWCRERVSHSWR